MTSLEAMSSLRKIKMARNYKEIFEPGKFYHIYNRAVGDELLFHNSENYLYFLSKFDIYLSSFFEYYAFCLLPNHFHFIIQIKDYSNNSFNGESPADINKLISESFRKFAISFSQAINKQENRLGSLFMRPFKRILISNENYLKQLILYVHLNPVHHGLSENFEKYYWSSYRILNDSRPTKINKQKVIDLFEDYENLVYVHKQKKEFEELKILLLKKICEIRDDIAGSDVIPIRYQYMKKLQFVLVLLSAFLFFTLCKRSGSDYHNQSGIKQYRTFPVTFIRAEKLNLVLNGLSSHQEDLSKYDKEWTGSKQIKVESKENSSFSIRLKSLIEKRYSIIVYYTKGPEYGNVGVYIGNQKYGEIQGYNPVILPGCKITLPDIPNPDFRMELRFVIEGKDENSKEFYTGLEGIDVVPLRNFIGEWFLIGPFADLRDPHNNLTGFDSIYPPEEAIDLKEKYRGLAGQLLSWKYVKTPDNGYFTPPVILRSCEFAVEYAVTYIYSTENTNCVLFAGSDGPVKVFFNNQMLYNFTGNRQAEPDQAMIIIQIKHGWNKLLMKTLMNHDRNGFYARLLDPDKMIFISAEQKRPLKTGI